MRGRDGRAVRRLLAIHVATGAGSKGDALDAWMRAPDRPGSGAREESVESFLTQEKCFNKTRTRGAPTYLPPASNGSTLYPLRLISSSVRMSGFCESDIAVPGLAPGARTDVTARGTCDKKAFQG